MYRKHVDSMKLPNDFRKPRWKKLQASKPNKSPCTDRRRIAASLRLGSWHGKPVIVASYHSCFCFCLRSYRFHYRRRSYLQHCHCLRINWELKIIVPDSGWCWWDPSPLPFLFLFLSPMLSLPLSLPLSFPVLKFPFLFLLRSPVFLLSLSLTEVSVSLLQCIWLKNNRLWIVLPLSSPMLTFPLKFLLAFPSFSSLFLLAFLSP